ncbi:MAG TPA: methyltransferase [Terriglobales bacterium]|nr:methyltransferase [Terriglobales bacterium]
MATVPSTRPAPAQLAPVEQIFQISGAYVLSAALYHVLKLRIPDRLAGGPRTAAALAGETGMHAGALHRVLRALAMTGMFAEVAPGTYGLTPISDTLRSDHPSHAREMALFMSSPFHFDVFREMGHSIQTGKPAVEKAFGKPCFEVLQEQTEVWEEFQRAMTCFSAEIAPAVLEAYDFSGIQTLMDVAGGHGRTLCEILMRYPKMRGILFDLPAVVEHEECKTCILNLSGRCERVAGSFFENIPAGADAYYMQHILHDWDDEHALQILGNVHRALAGVPNGRLLVVDTLLPEGPEPHTGKMLDLEMMLLPGGKERTEPEWRALFEQGGFRLARIAETRGTKSVLEARPQ